MQKVSLQLLKFLGAITVPVRDPKNPRMQVSDKKNTEQRGTWVIKKVISQKSCDTVPLDFT